MKQFHCLVCIAKNCGCSRKIAPLLNLTRASLLVAKLTAKAQLNCEIYKSWRKCWKIKSVFVIDRSSPVSWKAWTLPWKLQELKKIPWENFVVAVSLDALFKRSNFVKVLMYFQNNKNSPNCIIVVFFVVSLFLYLLFLVNLLIFDFCKLVYLLSLVISWFL